MKHLIVILAFGAVLILSASDTLVADEPHTAVTENLAFSTEYVFRFVSQTMGEPALSGGIDWDPGNGFYLGAWGSNVDFGDDAQLEVDFYGGYAHEFSSGWSVDTGLIDYEYYANRFNDNILEIFSSVSYGPASLGVYYDIGDGEYVWIEGSLEHDIGPVSVVLSAGVLEVNDGEGYTGWSLGAGHSLGGIDLSLTWFDANSKGRELFGKTAGGRLVLELARQF